MNRQTESKEETAVHKTFNTKLLMIFSALFMGLMGVLGTFLPQEMLEYYGAAATELAVIAMKIMGALYLGFAVLNWMARGNIIGGIYSRPVALGNFFHFVLVAIILLKFLVTHSPVTSFTAGAGIYSVFAGCFGYILFAGGKSCG